MMTETQPPLSRSVDPLLRRRLTPQTVKTPVALTAMIKRAQGYNPESRDWEYLVLDGPATKIVERGKLEKCNRCHEKYDDTDFVTMHYLNPRPAAFNS